MRAHSQRCLQMIVHIVRVAGVSQMQHVIAGIIWIHDHFTVVISHERHLAAPLSKSVFWINCVAAPSGDSTTVMSSSNASPVSSSQDEIPGRSVGPSRPPQSRKYSPPGLRADFVARRPCFAFDCRVPVDQLQARPSASANSGQRRRLIAHRVGGLFPASLSTINSPLCESCS